MKLTFQERPYVQIVSNCFRYQVAETTCQGRKRWEGFLTKKATGEAYGKLIAPDLNSRAEAEAACQAYEDEQERIAMCGRVAA